MNITRILNAVPRLLASKISIFIFIGLFIYLVGFGILGLLIPALEPSSTIQLILGNYTNVASATGASIAAGAGVTAVATTSVVLHHVRKNNQRYDELKKSHDEMKAMVAEIHHTLRKTAK